MLDPGKESQPGPGEQVEWRAERESLERRSHPDTNSAAPGRVQEYSVQSLLET